MKNVKTLLKWVAIFAGIFCNMKAQPDYYKLRAPTVENDSFLITKKPLVLKTKEASFNIHTDAAFTNGKWSIVGMIIYITNNETVHRKDKVTFVFEDDFEITLNHVSKKKVNVDHYYFFSTDEFNNKMKVKRIKSVKIKNGSLHKTYEILNVSDTSYFINLSKYLFK